MTALTAAQSSAFQVLVEHFGQSRLEQLPPNAVRAVDDSEGSAGWRLSLPVDYTERARDLWFILPRNLPLEPPLVRVQPSAFRKWPHTDPDGDFCLWHEGEAPVGYSAAEQMRKVLERVADVFNLIYPIFDEVRAKQQFENEWPSYWSPASGQNRVSATTVLLLDAIYGDKVAESALVQGSNEKIFLLVGGSPKLRTAWAAALGADVKQMKSLDTVLAPLSHPPIGAPENVPALVKLIEGSSSIAVREQLAQLLSRGQNFYVVVYVNSQHPTFGALEVAPVFERRPISGFQNAKALRRLRDQRKIASWRVGTAVVQRADSAWLRGRGFDNEAELLSTKHVVVVGCGSLGGLVARSLASGGVGRLTLIDPDVLTTSNLGRHVLSAKHLGYNKAKALAEDIRLQIPNVQVDPISKDVCSYVMPSGPDAPDLVIGATANWPSENFLARLPASGKLKALQLTWAERHAIAGHALLVADASVDATALYDADGFFLRTATDWNGQNYPLPGCAGSHQPGTFNRIQRIASLAVEQAIQFLVGDAESEHRVWLGDAATLNKLGGSWTSHWPVTTDAVERTLISPLPSRET